MSHSLIFPHVQYSRLEASDVSKLEEDWATPTQCETPTQGADVVHALEQLGYVNTTLFQFSVAFFILSELSLQSQLNLLLLFFSIAFHLLAAVSAIIARCHGPDPQSYADAAYNSTARKVVHRVVCGMTVTGAGFLLSSIFTFDYNVLLSP